MMWWKCCCFFMGIAFLNIANLHLSQGIRELEGQHIMWTRRVHGKSAFNLLNAIIWQFVIAYRSLGYMDGY